MNTRRMIVWALPIAVGASAAWSHENIASATPPGISPVASYAPAGDPAPADPAYSPATPAAQPPRAPDTPPAGPTGQNPSDQNLSPAPRDPARAVLEATKQLSDTDAIALTPAQSATIHTQEGKLEASKKNIESSVTVLRTHLASQVRTGAINRARVQADESAVVNALRVHGQQEADALDAIHASLDSKQRGDVVAAARAQQTGLTERQAPPETSQPESANDKDKQKEHLDRLTRDLDLDSGQQQRVATILASQPPPEPKGEARAQRTEAMLDAFQKDTFNARTAVPAPSPSLPTMVHDRVERRVRFLSQLLLVLRPDQRDKLASMIESDHMNRGHEHEHSGEKND